ncbi:MAG: UDP-glucose 4-epimerase GalE [Planctomycetaceae bacterium]|nr:UDP-glucose 4-epimerase GalE [Planctomycetaceae bacterium]
MSVLVTGGAGYIGSHAVKLLRDAGREVVVVDNLYRGHKAAIPEDVPFYEGSLQDGDVLTELFEEEEITEVLHFAALAYVGESVQDPLWYYENNVNGSLTLFSAMAAAGVKKLVFSSTCATYGEPDTLPIVETLPQQPINPYGHSKLMVERILRDLVASDPEWSVTALRYFNVAGCAEDGHLGEDHQPETHLIPLVLQAALGNRDSITIFGSDYDTPDGTCIRDYIHVEDLGRAHLLALEHLVPGDYQYFNLGIGRGFSVKEVIDSVQRVTGKEIRVEMGDRRPGDPPTLYADAGKIRDAFGWSPKFTELDDIVRTAANWFESHPEGYGD